MATIGELATLVTARTAPFEKGMARSQNSLDALKKRVGITNTSLASMATKLAGAAVAFAGVSRGISDIVEEFAKVDDIAKQAARIGETTEEISRLQFAAELTGAGARKLSDGLEVMQKRLGEAAMGTGRARATIDSLGLSVDSLIRMSPADAFRTIADAISGLDTQAAKAAATANIFSRANQDLVNTLELGSAGLQKAAKESDAFGNTVSNNTVKSVEEANDAMTRLGAVFGGLKRSLAIGIAPLVESLATEFGRLTANLLPLQKAFGGLGEKLPLSGLGLMLKLLKGINDQIDNLKNPPKELVERSRGGTSFLEDILRPLFPDAKKGFATFGFNPREQAVEKSDTRQASRQRTIDALSLLRGSVYRPDSDKQTKLLDRIATAVESDPAPQIVESFQQ